MNIFKKTFNKIRTLGYLFQLSVPDKKFINFALKKWKKSNNIEPEGEILIDQMFYDIYIFQLSYITNYLQIKHNLHLKHYHLIPREKILLSKFFKYFRKYSRINRVYESFGSSYAFGQTYFKESEKICEHLNFTSKRELLNYKLENILIGDLIYDTYLRTYVQPTIDFEDPRFKLVVLNAHDIFFSCKNYLDTKKVKKIIVSHSVYIQYGILARLALSRGIDVYNALNFERTLKKLSLDHHLPTPRHHLYPSLFEVQKNQEKLREKARVVLEKRLNGEIDRGIKYMSSSSYADREYTEEKLFLNNGKPKVVMMLHCFYDAPHTYRHMLFEDFYEWVVFVFNKAKSLNIDLIVKPHPNGKEFNEEIIKNLNKKHPHIRIINKNVSNKQIISEKPDLLLTVNGTVVHEFAYHGIKVLVAGDHPGFEYNFSKCPETISEYAYYLEHPEKLKINIDKSEIEEFFYMHYLSTGFGRIKGNNDIFHSRRRNYSSENNDIYLELVKDAEEGLFDNAFTSYDEAFSQVD
jgi:hypothetical protein|tara:strand:+ start:1633 stop:3195 length:1563 start_codon:yes stop_codon:yes gene_type:complete